jgi:hypothetical protein
MAEVFLPFRNSPVVAISEVRSTLIMAGIQAVRAQGLFGPYSESLSSGVREQIAGLAAGIWVPVEIAVAHYSAMDRLGIDQSVIEALGADVAARTWKHILAPVFARSKRIGPKPWEALSHAQETVQLNWRGGDVRIFKEKPTQALYEWAGQPCADIPYFVTSFGSFMRELLKLFSSRAYQHVVPERCSSTTIALRLVWVQGPVEGPSIELPETPPSHRPR